MNSNAASAPRVRLQRAGAALLAIAVGFASPVAGSFECLPGPIPGGISDWAGRNTIDRPRVGSTWRAAFSLGRPAGVRDLAWTHGWVGRRIGSVRLSGEGFVLAMEDFYQEQVVGLWVGSGSLDIGLRRWRVAWDEGLARSGWTGSLGIKIRLMPIRVAAGIQDLRLGRGQASSPSMRIGGLAAIHAESSIDLLCGVHRYRDRWGGVGGIRWRCTAALTVQEEIAIPGGSPRTGLQIDAGSARIGLWFEPSNALGWRLGMTSRFDL